MLIFLLLIVCLPLVLQDILIPSLLPLCHSTLQWHRPLIAAGQAMGKDSKTLYGYFCNALDRALNDTAQTIDASAQREDLARMLAVYRQYAERLLP